jgi:hypothetical protein
MVLVMMLLLLLLLLLQVLQLFVVHVYSVMHAIRLLEYMLTLSLYLHIITASALETIQ